MLLLAGACQTRLDATCLRRSRLLLLAGCAIPLVAQQNNYLEATRPTVSSGAAIQQKGVLQIEAGYDAFFADSDYDRTQAVSSNYAATNWLRLDLATPGWRSTNLSVDTPTTGFGNWGLGAKLVIFKQGKSHTIPGIAVQYAETFASATNPALRSRYHQGTFIVRQTFGDWAFKLNGSLIADCHHPFGCGLRGQGVFGASYKATSNLTLASDVFGQTVSVSAPPGAYGLLGATDKLRRDLTMNGGIRFGLNDSASRLGFTVGLTVGLGGEPTAVLINTD